MLLPVDPVVEPVEDQEQHADRDERDDRLEPLAVARERAEHGLRDDPRDGGRAEREDDAAEQRPPVAPLRADHARHQRGEDEDRLEALAEDDDRAVRDDRDARARAAPDPLLGARRARRRALPAPRRARRTDAFALIRRTSPSWSPVPYQNSDSTPWKSDGARPRRRCSGPSSKMPYASIRADSATPQSPARGRGLHPVERRGDDVEVRRLRRVLPLRRDRAPAGRRPPTPTVASSASGATGVPPRLAVTRLAREARERRLDATRRGPVAREEARLEVGERGRGAVAERDRLLDLEVLRDAPVADAASVLDRDEAEEPIELAGAPERLLGR